MDKQHKQAGKPSRRRFLAGGVRGAFFLGLTGVWSRLSGQARAGETPAGRPGRVLGKEFTYDVSNLRKTDPRLLRYEETSKWATGFKEARRLALDKLDQVYIAGDQGIRRFNLAGQRLQQFSLNERPRCLAVADDGTLLVGLKNHVETYSAAGALLARWEPLDTKAVLTSLAVAEADVFVADAGNRLVLRYDRAGKLVRRIGKKDASRNIPGFVVPSPYFDLAVAPEGLLWVANPGQHRLEAYTFDGDFELSWGEAGLDIEGFCGCCNPVNFALLADSRFVTCEKGLTRVKVYSVRGKLEAVVAGPEQFPLHADTLSANPVGLDVAVDAQGRVLIVDPLSSEVRLFTRRTPA